MKNSKIIRFVLMMAVLMQSGVSWAAETVVSTPVALAVSPSTPSGVPGGAWYERHPKIAWSLAGLCVSACLYGRAWWNNRQLSKNIQGHLRFNALEVNPFKIQNFALNDFCGNGKFFPNFIQIRVEGGWKAFLQEFENYIRENNLFVENGAFSKRAVLAQAHEEVEQLQKTITALNERTAVNKVIKDCCVWFASRPERNWPNKHIDRDYYTDLFNVITQCKTVEEFQELDSLIGTKIMTRTWKSIRSPFYTKIAMQHWDLMKKYMRMRYIWAAIKAQG